MRGDRVTPLLLALVLVMGLSDAGFVAAGVAETPRAPQRTAMVADAPVPRASPAGGRSVPVTLDIPAISLHTDLMTLGLQPDGRVEVPPLDSPDAGWYGHSPTPGQLGPAVLLGHVDSARTGPGVFYDLRMLAPGDAVRVTRADGTVAAFRVDRVERTRSRRSRPRRSTATSTTPGCG